MERNEMGKNKGGTELERNEKNAWNDFPERNGKIKYRSNGLHMSDPDPKSNTYTGK